MSIYIYEDTNEEGLSGLLRRDLRLKDITSRSNLNSLLWCEKYRTDHLFTQASPQYLEPGMISEDIVSNGFRSHLQFSLERAVEHGVEEVIETIAGGGLLGLSRPDSTTRAEHQAG